MLSTSFTWNDLLFMLQGAWVTIQLTAWAMLLGTVGGLVCGLLRHQFPRLTFPLAWILDVFRSVPLLIQFVLLNAFKSIADLNITAFEVGAIVLGLYAAAYCTEIVRSGLDAVPTGIYRAGRSLGMTHCQCLGSIVLPMATRIAFPGWLNLTLGVMKDSSLVLWIGIIELLRASQTIVTRIQEPLFVLCIAGMIYYAMSWAVAAAGNVVEKKWLEHD